MNLEQIIQTIKINGGRITKIRRAILEILHSADHPVATIDLDKTLKKKNIKADRTTIYREMVYLVESKIAKRVQLGDDAKYFEINGNHHHHLVCTNCHSITEMVLDDHLIEQEKKIWKKTKFKVLDHTLEFFGVCVKCNVV